MPRPRTRCCSGQPGAAAVAFKDSEAARTPGSSSIRASIASESSKICLEARPARSCGFASRSRHRDRITHPSPSSRPPPHGWTRRRRFRGRGARLALVPGRSQPPLWMGVGLRALAAQSVQRPRASSRPCGDVHHISVLVSYRSLAAASRAPV